MTGKDMLKGIQNLDATLIEEAEFGKFQKHRAGISGKKKLLFLLAATLIMGTMTAAAVYTRWSTTAQTRYNPSQDVKEQAEKSGLSVMLEKTKGAANLNEVLSVTDQDTEGDLVGYLDKQTTRQKIVTEDTDQFTYRSWMKMKSIESALGYASVELDLNKVIYPKTENDRWEKIVKEFASNVGTYWQPFSGFDGTTVSDCDSRIRTFLNSRYEDEREDDTITLKTTGTEKTAYYVIRTHNESVEKVTGGTAEQLEDSAWLIRAEKSEVTITLGAADHRYYYEKGAKNK